MIDHGTAFFRECDVIVGALHVESIVTPFLFLWYKCLCLLSFHKETENIRYVLFHSIEHLETGVAMQHSVQVHGFLATWVEKLSEVGDFQFPFLQRNNVNIQVAFYIEWPSYKTLLWVKGLYRKILEQHTWISGLYLKHARSLLAKNICINKFDLDGKLFNVILYTYSFFLTVD